MVTRVCYKTIDETINYYKQKTINDSVCTVHVIYSLSYLTQTKTLKNRQLSHVLSTDLVHFIFRRSHACITHNFSLLLHTCWAFSNEMVSSSAVTSTSLLSTGFSLLNISSAMFSDVKDPPVLRRSSASRKSDSSISSFSCIFSSARRASQISNSLASSGSD